MNQEEYIRSLFAQPDEILADVIKSIERQGMPSISVSPEGGIFLTMLVRTANAKQILEIGALGGYSGICLLRGLRGEGHLTSLELKQEYADLAHANLKKAGVGEQVTYRIGEALDSLGQLEREGKTFDFFFIDADKPNYSNYLGHCIRLANPGAIIVADNVLWHGRVYDETAQEDSTRALRAFNEKIAGDSRLESLLIPLGDGMAMARVKEK
ncbi:O-methyltransferase [Aneurinibacillus aneurinilyticus]|jgi:predicted O-methyltransferase YrrM|uniref:O-methyltransferase n=1 Tax=Aneurinibacillus aneurinilyticus TaxID=1391 RepID=A0A848CRS9_ANEAE|nr:O-methyltransferase [Aneurinibacillus aneurinilyticus]MCI1694836.1 O-methyltransferase [Aneurinibacillus aneurinilyticus]MED0669414.1 O-methyltransferase [Aneurinibacillus aneurinilyticus]NMF00195.1 O-methyltransferase [Aneurinibacillus aneurinilyticus]